MIWTAIEKYRDAGLLVLRLGVGVSYMYFHGWGKISGGPETWARYGESMGHFGVTFWPTFWGFMAAFAEFFGGLFVATGLFFRPAVMLMFLTMAVATTGHVVTGRGSPAHSLKMAFVFAGLFVIGPGKYSVDAWISSRRNRVPAGV